MKEAAALLLLESVLQEHEFEERGVSTDPGPDGRLVETLVQSFVLNNISQSTVLSDCCGHSGRIGHTVCDIWPMGFIFIYI